MTMVLLGLLSGIAFGFVIQRAGATNADEMARAHLMLNGRIPQFMVAAVAVSALGLLGLTAAGVGRMLVLYHVGARISPFDHFGLGQICDDLSAKIT